MAILESVKKLASKVGAETNGRTIAEQINNINRHLDSTGSRDIAEAVSKFADVESGGSGEAHFNRMVLRLLDASGSIFQTAIIYNNSTSVDISNIKEELGFKPQKIMIINPVDELIIKELSKVGDTCTVGFVPTANCKVYEGETELDLNEIFEPIQTPTGPSTYEPNGINVHYLHTAYSPYDGKTRGLQDRFQPVDFIIE